VVEPTGVKCYSMRNNTQIGIMSEDCVGYGPVEYMSKFAKTGRYDIYVKLFSKSNSSILPVVCLIEITKNFGKFNEEKVRKTVLLKTEKEMLLVDSITI
jgi:hypothetical protein